MAKPSPDREFETRFFEAVHRRDPRCADVIELLGGLYTRQGRIADGREIPHHGRLENVAAGVVRDFSATTTASASGAC